jgi:phenylacetic acid degradation protein
MAKIYSIDGVKPIIDPSSFIHPEAVIIGDVIIGKDCYIGPTACLRGDFGQIIIANQANIQDGCVLHSYPRKAVVIEEGGHIGHGAILHGCHIGKNALVGMNAVVMDDAIIGDNALVAAMAFVKANFSLPPNMLAAGMPARIIRALSDEEVNWKRNGTLEYVDLAKRCINSLKSCEPLTKPDINRPKLQTRPSRPPT